MYFVLLNVSPKHLELLFKYSIDFCFLEEMVKKRKLEKSKWNQFGMENFCLKFPHLEDEIAAQLNPQTLVNLKWVDK